MSFASCWTIKCLSGANEGTEQTLADWGICAPMGRKQPSAMSTYTFRTVVADASATPQFAWGDRAALYWYAADGTPARWFVGFWTKTPATISDTDESIAYELSCIVWWVLSRLIYVNPWQATTSGGSTVSTVETPVVVPTLGPSGIETDLGSAVITALNYALTACAAQPGGGFVPFSIGTVSFNDMIVPYETMINVTLAQFINSCSRWSPDVLLSVDYTEAAPGAPPVVNMIPRASLSGVTLELGGGNSPVISPITPRPDLVVPGVFLYFMTINTIDGVPNVNIEPDVYPAGTLQTTLGVLGAVIQMAGGRVTFQKQNLVTQDFPTSLSDEDAFPWVKNKKAAIFAAQSYGPTDGLGATWSQPYNTYDVANIKLVEINVSQDPNDPGISLRGGSSLSAVLAAGQEIVGGAVNDWMITEQGVDAATVIVNAVLQYTGTDAVTQALFDNTQTPGFMALYWRLNATNGSTGTYQRIASAQAAETPMVGLAELLYNARSMLHYEGSVVLTEQACSGAIQLNNVLNISGGTDAGWAAMNAQIVGIEEDIDNGRTTIRIGPPTMLGISEMVDLLRAARIRQPAYNVNNRTSSDATQDQITGHIYAAHTVELAGPPGSTKSANGLWGAGVALRKNPSGSNWQINVQRGTLRYNNSTASEISVDGMNGWYDLTGSETQVILYGLVSAGSGGTGGLVANSVGVYFDDTSRYDPTLADWQPNSSLENDGSSPPSGPVQTLFKKQIATLAWSAGVPSISAAVVNTNMIMCLGAFEGIAAIYPKPL